MRTRRRCTSDRTSVTLAATLLVTVVVVVVVVCSGCCYGAGAAGDNNNNNNATLGAGAKTRTRTRTLNATATMSFNFTGSDSLNTSESIHRVSTSLNLSVSESANQSMTAPNLTETLQRGNTSTPTMDSTPSVNLTETLQRDNTSTPSLDSSPSINVNSSTASLNATGTVERNSPTVNATPTGNLSSATITLPRDTATQNASDSVSDSTSITITPPPTPTHSFSANLSTSETPTYTNETSGTASESLNQTDSRSLSYSDENATASASFSPSASYQPPAISCQILSEATLLDEFPWSPIVHYGMLNLSAFNMARTQTSNPLEQFNSELRVAELDKYDVLSAVRCNDASCVFLTFAATSFGIDFSHEKEYVNPLRSTAGHKIYLQAVSPTEPITYPVIEFEASYFAATFAEIHTIYNTRVLWESILLESFDDFFLVVGKNQATSVRRSQHLLGPVAVSWAQEPVFPADSPLQCGKFPLFGRASLVPRASRVFFIAQCGSSVVTVDLSTPTHPTVLPLVESVYLLSEPQYDQDTGSIYALMAPTRPNSDSDYGFEIDASKAVMMYRLSTHSTVLSKWSVASEIDTAILNPSTLSIRTAQQEQQHDQSSTSIQDQNGKGVEEVIFRVLPPVFLPTWRQWFVIGHEHSVFTVDASGSTAAGASGALRFGGDVTAFANVTNIEVNSLSTQSCFIVITAGRYLSMRSCYSELAPFNQSFVFDAPISQLTRVDERAKKYGDGDGSKERLYFTFGIVSDRSVGHLDVAFDLSARSLSVTGCQLVDMEPIHQRRTKNNNKLHNNKTRNSRTASSSSSSSSSFVGYATSLTLLNTTASVAISGNVMVGFVRASPNATWSPYFRVDLFEQLIRSISLAALQPRPSPKDLWMKFPGFFAQCKQKNVCFVPFTGSSASFPLAGGTPQQANDESPAPSPSSSSVNNNTNKNATAPTSTTAKLMSSVYVNSSLLQPPVLWWHSTTQTDVLYSFNEPSIFLKANPKLKQFTFHNISFAEIGGACTNVSRIDFLSHKVLVFFCAHVEPTRTYGVHNDSDAVEIKMALLSMCPDEHNEPTYTADAEAGTVFFDPITVRKEACSINNNVELLKMHTTGNGISVSALFCGYYFYAEFTTCSVGTTRATVTPVQRPFFVASTLFETSLDNQQPLLVGKHEILLCEALVSANHVYITNATHAALYHPVRRRFDSISLLFSEFGAPGDVSQLLRSRSSFQAARITEFNGYDQQQFATKYALILYPTPVPLLDITMMGHGGWYDTIVYCVMGRLNMVTHRVDLCLLPISDSVLDAAINATNFAFLQDPLFGRIHVASWVPAFFADLSLPSNISIWAFTVTPTMVYNEYAAMYPPGGRLVYNLTDTDVSKRKCDTQLFLTKMAGLFVVTETCDLIVLDSLTGMPLLQTTQNEHPEQGNNNKNRHNLERGGGGSIFVNGLEDQQVVPNFGNKFPVTFVGEYVYIVHVRLVKSRLLPPSSPLRAQQNSTDDAESLLCIDGLGGTVFHIPFDSGDVSFISVLNHPTKLGALFVAFDNVHGSGVIAEYDLSELFTKLASTILTMMESEKNFTLARPMYQMIRKLHIREVPYSWRPYFPLMLWEGVQQIPRSLHETGIIWDAAGLGLRGELMFDALSGVGSNNAGGGSGSSIVFEELNFQGNKIAQQLNLESLPQNLLRLNLSNNSLIGSLDVNSLPPTLVVLDVSRNRLSGSLPEVASNVTTGMTQQPGGAGRKGILRGKDDFTIELIDLSFNALNGTLARDYLQKLPLSLRIFNISHNAFDGALPSLEYEPSLAVAATPPLLTEFSAAYSGLGGSIASIRAEMLAPNLKRLDLSGNRLTVKLNGRSRNDDDDEAAVGYHSATTIGQLQLHQCIPSIQQHQCNIREINLASNVDMVTQLNLSHISPSLTVLNLSNNRGILGPLYIDPSFEAQRSPGLVVDINGTSVDVIVTHTCPFDAGVFPNASAACVNPTIGQIVPKPLCASSTEIDGAAFVIALEVLSTTKRGKVITTKPRFTMPHYSSSRSAFDATKHCTFDPTLLIRDQHNDDVLNAEVFFAAMEECLPTFDGKNLTFARIRPLNTTAAPPPATQQQYLSDYALELYVTTEDTAHPSLTFATDRCDELAVNGTFCFTTFSSNLYKEDFTVTLADGTFWMKSTVHQNAQVTTKRCPEKEFALNTTLYRLNSNQQVFPHTFLDIIKPCTNDIDYSSVLFENRGRLNELLLITSDGHQNAFTSLTCNTFQIIAQCPDLPSVPTDPHPTSTFKALGIAITSPLQTVSWAPCDGGASTVGFHRLASPICRPITDVFNLPLINSENPSCSDQSCSTTSPLVNDRHECGLEAGKLSSQAHCWLSKQYASSKISASFGALYDKYNCDKFFNGTTDNGNNGNPITTDTDTDIIGSNSTCVNAPTRESRDDLCMIAGTFGVDVPSMASVKVKFYCRDNGAKVSIVTCDDKYLLMQIDTTRCVNALQLTCSPCFPYVEPTAIALPYLALVLSAIKDIFFILLGAWVLSFPRVRRFFVDLYASFLVRLLPYEGPAEKEEWRREWNERLNPEVVREKDFTRSFDNLNAGRGRVPSRIFSFNNDGTLETHSSIVLHKRPVMSTDTSETTLADSDAKIRYEAAQCQEDGLSTKALLVVDNDDDDDKEGGGRDTPVIDSSSNRGEDVPSSSDFGLLDFDSKFYEYYTEHITCRGTRMVMDEKAEQTQRLFLAVRTAFETRESRIKHEMELAAMSGAARSRRSTVFGATLSSFFKVSRTAHSFAGPEGESQELDDKDVPLLSLEELRQVDLDTALTRFKRKVRFKRVILSRKALNRTFTPQAWMLILELLFGIIFQVICLAESGHHTTSAWDTYQAMYFRYVNSCVSVSLVTNSVMRRWYSAYPLQIDIFIISSVVIMLPPLITHIIPGMILYGWFAFAVTAVMILLGYWMHIFEKKTGHRTDWLAKLVRVAWRMLMTSFIALLLQTSFNYSLLFYERERLGLTYMSVMTYEYNSRRLDCFLTETLKSLAGNFQALSIFSP